MSFCDNVISNGSILCRALDSVASILKYHWALVKVVVRFFSFGLVLAITVVFVVFGYKKKERKERED